MNIACATDNNYVQHCGVMLASLFENNKGEEIHIYLLTEGLTGKNKASLENIVKQYGGHFHYCLLDSNLLQKFPPISNGTPHITLAAYNRLFISNFIPEKETKVIYMDCDMIVCSSLKDLWETNIDNFALGAVRECWERSQESFIRLGYDCSYFYFNSGLLLINIGYWKSNNVQQRLLEYVRLNPEKLVCNDQDALNATLYAEWTELPFKWNIIPTAFYSKREQYILPEYINSVKEAVKSPGIIHYFYKPKPWDPGCWHPARKEYFKYAQFTEWKNFRPSFHLTSFIKHHLALGLEKLGIRKSGYISETITY